MSNLMELCAFGARDTYYEKKQPAYFMPYGDNQKDEYGLRNLFIFMFVHEHTQEKNKFNAER